MKDNLFNCIKNYRVRYVGLFETLVKWTINRNKSYHNIDLEGLKQKRKSDTIFILGGSEAINSISQKQWDEIAKNDSIGINWWPVHDFVPTYYYSNYPRNKIHFQYYKRIIGKRSQRYKNKSIFFISGNRAAQRGLHPRVIPELFPDSPQFFFYNYENPLVLQKGSFSSASFDRTIYYRGALSLLLSLVDKIGYKNIVLMGIDLKNRVHFYDKYPEMQWQFETGYCEPVNIKKNQINTTIDTKNNTKLPMDEYIYAVNELYFQPKNVSLYVGSSESLLSKKIPVYRFLNNERI